ncbi:MAG: phosphoglucosamine mutase [Clostridia bacterium]|nr:phosphoglucosamine mutase [Clostridia bacterium]
MGRLFGTDGARGIANSELTCELAMQIGRATAMVLIATDKKRPKVMIGMDTRISSNMLASAITAGLCSVGADVMQLGVIPTPAVAFLVRKYEYDAAVMITASHNPCEYNGIKIFQSDGYKLPDELEEKIEAIILDGVRLPPVKIGADIGRLRTTEMPVFDYVSHLISTVEGVDFSGYKVAVDCANGAASVTAPELFAQLGVDSHIKSSIPNGININRDCGSTSLNGLQRFVKEYKCDVGFAFDGDADRMLAVDENGGVVDGDKIIAICAKDMKNAGVLANDTAVVTVMSNMGFFEFCKNNGIKVETTKVGDRYVLENMVENGYKIGGEQSGHVIFSDFATTGDGQLTAIQLLSVMKRTGKKLSELAAEMPVFPQVLINVRVSQMGKARCNNDIEIRKAIESAERELGDGGRVLVRVSGTEPLVRVMLEGRDEEKIRILAEEIAEVIKERLI